jgi:thiamine transport system permease protein
VGIILGHVFINAPWSTIVLGERWLRFDETYEDVESQLSLSKTLKLFKIRLPLMKTQVLSSFATVFAFCLVSFAIPLTLGGGPQYSTLEVLTYEWIRVYSDWGAAAAIGCLNLVLQVLVFILVLRPLILKTDYRKRGETKVRFGLAQLPVFLLSALILYVFIRLLMPVDASVAQMSAREWQEVALALFRSVLLSMGVALITGICIFVLMMKGWASWLRLWPLQSAMSLGIVIYMFTFQLPAPVIWCAYAFGLFVLFFPIIWRQSEDQLSEIRGKWNDVIRINKIPPAKKMSLMLSLTKKPLLYSMLFVFTWSLGEFSVGKVLLSENVTLPLLIHGYMGSYRLEQAAVVAGILLLITVVAAFCIREEERG